MRSLALDPFWESHISSYTMTMSDLGEALITLGFDAREIDLKRLVCLMMLMMSSLERLHLLGWT